VSELHKQRLDKELLKRGLVVSRSQAEDIIQRGFVTVNGKLITKAGYLIDATRPVEVKSRVSFVSRAGEKLYSVIDVLKLNFQDKVVLDVGSSTGGFTELALRNGAKKVIAVDVGTDQMHPSLRNDPRLELHEKTDIRDFKTNHKIDIVVADVSFISLREILPHVARLCNAKTWLVAMVKPQFEVGTHLKHKGVIRNDKMRRNILKEFEKWTQNLFIIVDKADSGVPGAKGNRERFYLLKKLG
jgi:23S rRNA (cytidine1920-2'-O)/16S rRNA (cytidine1409-2'-O)-methyltransferase